MGFVTREWKNRLMEFSGRRKLTNVATGEILYFDVERAEGAPTQEGDSWSASNSNDLEERISTAVDEVDQSLRTFYVKGISIYNSTYLLNVIENPPFVVCSATREVKMSCGLVLNAVPENTYVFTLPWYSKYNCFLIGHSSSGQVCVLHAIRENNIVVAKSWGTIQAGTYYFNCSYLRSEDE